MLGLTTTQLLLLAAGAVYLFFTKSPGGGWLAILKKFLGGDTENLLGKVIADFYKCADCTPEEEKKVEEALTILVNHAIRHRLSLGSTAETRRLKELEAKLEELSRGTQPASH